MSVEVIEMAIPSDMIQRRRQDVRSSMAGIKLPKIGTFLAADEIMLLEGGPSGLEDLLFGNAEQQAAEADPFDLDDDGDGDLGYFGATTKTVAKPAAKAAAKPATKATTAAKAAVVAKAPTINVAESKAKLTTLIDSRREAIKTASTEGKKALEVVKQLDTKVANLASAHAAAKAEVAVAKTPAAKTQAVAKVAKVAATLKTTDAVRTTKAAEAVRYAKVQAVGQVLAKNAITQNKLLTLVAKAKEQGQPAAAKKLAAAVLDIGAASVRMKQVRQNQIANWKVQGVADQAKVLKTATAGVAAKIAYVAAQTSVPVAQRQEAIAELKAKAEQYQEQSELVADKLRAAKAPKYSGSGNEQIERKAGLVTWLNYDQRAEFPYFQGLEATVTPSGSSRPHAASAGAGVTITDKSGNIIASSSTMTDEEKAEAKADYDAAKANVVRTGIHTTFDGTKRIQDSGWSAKLNYSNPVKVTEMHPTDQKSWNASKGSSQRVKTDKNSIVGETWYVKDGKLPFLTFAGTDGSTMGAFYKEASGLLVIKPWVAKTGLAGMAAAVVAGTKQVANAAVNLLKDAACALSKNPAVLDAVAAVATGGASVAAKVTGDQAGAQKVATNVANSVLSSACPAKSNGKPDLSPSTATAEAEKKSLAVPILIGGGAVATVAALLLL